MQFRFKVVIISTGFNNRDSNNKFSCVGPLWNHSINATGPNACPETLQSPGTGSDYQVCLTPCSAIDGDEYCCRTTRGCDVSGGCQQLWPIFDYYTVFQSACPNCLITSCDAPNYTCINSDTGLTQYEITFCPKLS